MDSKYEDESSLLKGNFSGTTDLLTIAHAAQDAAQEIRFHSWGYDRAKRIDLENLVRDIDEFVITFTVAWSALRLFILEDIKTRSN